MINELIMLNLLTVEKRQFEITYNTKKRFAWSKFVVIDANKIFPTIGTNVAVMAEL